jgi:galactonate dehydratase
MTIADVRLRAVVPDPEASFGGSAVSWLFVEVETDDGLVGIGECSNWPGGGNALVRSAGELLKSSLVGRDPGRIEQLWVELFRRFTYLGNRGLVTTVISGVDIALWDLKGKALGRPVHDLLGGAVRDAIPLYTHPGGATSEEAAENTLALVAEGYAAVKFDPFSEMGRFHTAYLSGEISAAGVRAAAAQIEGVRLAVGPDVDILVDFHGNYNAASALRCIRALQPYDITWFEEPFPPESLDALRHLRAQTDAPLCVGERLYTRWEFVPVLREGLANYVMPDVCWTGGISELRKIATLAEAYAVPVAPHGALGPLQTIAAAHVALVTPNLYRQEILGPDYQRHYGASLVGGLDIRDGMLFLSDAPGLGVELDEDWLCAHAEARR